MGSIDINEDELDDDEVDELLAQIAPSICQGDTVTGQLLNLRFIDPYSFEDPLDVSFYEDIWLAIALRNTLIYRYVFHCQPDNEVQSWRDYKEFNKLFNEFSVEQNKSIERTAKRMATNSKASQTSSSSTESQDNLQIPKSENATIEKGEKVKDVPTEPGKDLLEEAQDKIKKEAVSRIKMRFSNSILYGFKPRIFTRYTARKMLERVHGHLVLFPTEWLSKELDSKNWFYSMDRLPPITIYD